MPLLPKFQGNRTILPSTVASARATGTKSALSSAVMYLSSSSRSPARATSTRPLIRATFGVFPDAMAAICFWLYSALLTITPVTVTLGCFSM